MDSTQNWFVSNSDVLSDWAIVIISLGTLFIAHLARREFVKNNTKNHQVKVMTELISTLNTVRIDIQYSQFNKDGSSGGGGWTVKYNIFEIADLQNRKGLDEFGRDFALNQYNDSAVFYKPNSNQLANIKGFIDNPFLPKKIADELMNFYSVRTEAISRSTLCGNEEKLIIVETGILEEEKKADNIPDEHYLIRSGAFALRTWENLKTCSHNLMKAANNWFKTQGIEDVNLRIDYKN